MATSWLTLPFETQPSWVSGLARNADESEAPGQWRGLVGAWAPGLGGQGGLLYDVSGYAHHPTLTNLTLASAWDTGTRGPQLTLDGTNDYVDFTSTSLFDFPNTTFTVSLWVKPVAVASNRYLLNKRDTSGASGGWFLRTDATGTITARSTGLTNTAAGRTSVAVVAAGVWSMVTVIFTTDTVGLANDVVIYMNGVLSQGSLTAGAESYLASVISAKIGVQSDLLAGTYVNGAIDDVRIYDRGLTAEEIKAIYDDPWAMYRPRALPMALVTAAAVGGPSVNSLMLMGVGR
jgi:hypothetical protein